MTDPHVFFPHYYSTYCIHDLHEDCRQRCKHCEALCLCECHDEERDAQR